MINLARANQQPDQDGPHDSLDRECAGYDKGKKRPKYPDAHESLVMDDLVKVVNKARRGKMRSQPTSVTVYLLRNSGQGPSLLIEHIPGAFVDFLQELHGSKYATRWQSSVMRAWRATKNELATSSTNEPAEKPTKKTGKSGGNPVPPGPGRSRNELYNDLLPIFKKGFTDWHIVLQERVYVGLKERRSKCFLQVETLPPFFSDLTTPEDKVGRRLLCFHTIDPHEFTPD